MATVKREEFGYRADGQLVEAITLENNGFRAVFLTQGAILRSWDWPAGGGSVDVVLGCATLEDYTADTAYHGAVVGRYGNRIAGGKFTLDGRAFQLPVNNGPNHLHGGAPGFDKRVWQAELLSGAAVRFTIDSPDGEQGYPGNLRLSVTCRLAADGTLSYDYHATTSAPTVLNPTAHPYFNLAGHAAGEYESSHELQLSASSYVPKDATGIPTGGIRPVDGTAYDFRRPRGFREPAGHAELAAFNGYDHSWVVDGAPGMLRHAARATCPAAGRALEVWTTEPGIHFYNGFYNDGSPALMKGTGKPSTQRSGFALETQHFPDSPNQPDFPSTVLRPGEVFVSRTEYRPVRL